MADHPIEEEAKKAKVSLFQYAKRWGESPLPPALLATLILPLSLRPFQAVAVIFPPVLMFSSYLNLSDFEKDSAGLTAAWSGLYLLMARRRKTTLSQRLGVRGAVRGAAMGLAAVNVVGCGVAYAFGKRKVDEDVPP